MEGCRLQTVGCEASLADLRAELDRRRGTDEEAMQSCLSGVCQELRETQMSQMRALLDHGEKLDACGSKVQEQGSRLEELAATVGELSHCLVDIGSRLRDLKECVSGGGEDKTDFAVLGLRLQALEHLLATKRGQRAGAEDATTPAADQPQQATALEVDLASSSGCSPTRRPPSPVQQSPAEAGELPPGAPAAAAPAEVAVAPSSPRQLAGQAAESERAPGGTSAAGPSGSPASTKTLTPSQATPASAATPCAAAATTAEVRMLGQDFEVAVASDEAAAARSRTAQQPSGAGIGVVRSRSAPLGLQGGSKPQPAAQQKAVACQPVALPWSQRVPTGSYAQGQLLARPAPAAWQHQAPAGTHRAPRGGSPVPLRS
ncbi:unnamed protein product, partial [Prorocentrum cordatum]